MNRPAKINLILKSLALASGFAAFSVSARTATALGDTPLFFEANSSSQFSARGSDAQFSISPAGAQLALRKSDSIRAIQMQFIGANPQAQIQGDGEIPGKINYFTGNDPAQWRSGIPTFARVRVGEIYPGINLVYYGNQKRLEYDFTIAPGANPDSILIRFDGADKISVNAQGELVLKLGDGEIRQPKPLIYQTVGGAQKEISGGYKILDARTVAFAVGRYDRALPLVIDPILGYSTYFGGTSGETAWAVALNPNDGSIYIAGQTFSKLHLTNGVVVSPFSTNGSFSTEGAYTNNFSGGKQAGDAFVARFDNSGTNLIFLTYFGGSGDDAAYCVAVDVGGNAYIGGATDSTNFPVKKPIVNGSYQGTNIGGSFDKQTGLFPSDAFVAELDSTGSNLDYSTYLGGESAEAAYGIAVDSSSNVYVAGFTYSTNFPVTPGALQNHLACTNSVSFNANAFVSEITNGGGALVFSTYLGGTNFDEAKGIAVDTNGYIYVTGFTSSTNFPTTNSISQTFTNLFGTNSFLYKYNGHLLNNSTNRLNSASDAFVTKYYPSGTNYVYSTLLGGTNDDVANAVAVDGSGAAYVTGWTISTNFPATVGTNVITNHLTNNISRVVITTNAFLAKITNGIGTSAGVAYSVVFGGIKSDVGNGVAVDPAGNAFVVGTTSSTNFPTANFLGFLRGTNAGGNDVFVTAFNTNASALFYSVLLGGKTNDFGYGIAVDSADSAYIVGQIYSTNFATLDAFQTFRNGTNDTFLAKIFLTPPPPTLSAVLSGTNLLVSWPPVGQEAPGLFQLQSNTNLVSTNAWVAVTNASVFTNGAVIFKLSPTNQIQFFRLQQY